MKKPSPGSSLVRRVVSSLRTIEAPVRCNVKDVSAVSGAPVEASPSSRTRQTTGPSIVTSPCAMVWT